jgi:hypothetical protein
MKYNSTYSTIDDRDVYRILISPIIDGEEEDISFDVSVGCTKMNDIFNLKNIFKYYKYTFWQKVFWRISARSSNSKLCYFLCDIMRKHIDLHDIPKYSTEFKVRVFPKE